MMKFFVILLIAVCEWRGGDLVVDVMLLMSNILFVCISYVPRVCCCVDTSVFLLL